MCKELLEKIEGHHAMTEKLQKERFTIAEGVFEKEHDLHIERAKTSLLQIELGELSLLLQDVEHDPMVEARWEKQQQEQAREAAKKAAAVG